MNKRKLVETILVAFVLIMLAVFGFGILYAMPVIDDFDFFNMLKLNRYYPKLIPAAFSQAFWMFMNMQGAWLTNIVDMFIVGITKLNPIGVRIYLMLGFVFFAYSLFAFVGALKCLFHEKEANIIVLLALAVVIFVGMNLTPAREEIYWLTGVGGYTIPFSYALLGIKGYLGLFREYSVKKLVWTSACMTLASGGALNIAGFICAAGVSIFFYRFLNNKRESQYKKELALLSIPVAAGIISALINVAAPGNFARLKFESSQGMNIPLAFINTIRLIIGRVYALYKEQYLVLAAVVLFFAVLMIKETRVHVNGFQLLYTVVASLFVVGVSFFPVCLGYGRVTSLDRILFLVDLEVDLAFVLCIIVLGLYVKGIVPEKAAEINYVTLIPILILLAYMNLRVVGIGNQMLYKTALEFSNGTLKAHSVSEQGILDEIRNSTDQDVVVVTEYVNTEVSLNNGISDDKEHWVNVVVASCFDKQSVALEYK